MESIGAFLHVWAKGIPLVRKDGARRVHYMSIGTGIIQVFSKVHIDRLDLLIEEVLYLHPYWGSHRLKSVFS